MKHVRIENQTGEPLPVTVVGGGAGDGAILDGVSSSIKATVKDLTNSNPLTVAVTDANGDQITSFGGGTQYTEADVDATITGTAIMFESNTGTNTLSVVNNTTPLPVADAGGSLTVDNTVLSVVGGGTEAAAQRVTIASDSTGVLSVDDNGATLSVDDGAGSLTIDNTTLSVVGGGVEATALRVTLASDSTGLVSVDDNAASLSVDWNGTQPVTGSGTATGALRVELPTNGTGVIATVSAVTNITNAVTVAQATAANLNAQVVGTAAHAAPSSGNPVFVAGRASTAVPTDVGADGDVAAFWTNRNGAQVVTMAPHMGLVGGLPWTLTSETAQYTTQQTSAILVAGGVSDRIVVTSIQIQAGGTTAGTLQVYFGTGAYSRGTSLAIFDGEFAPSATSKPGVIMNGPFIAGALGDDILVTTSAAINPLTITVWYYIVT